MTTAQPSDSKYIVLRPTVHITDSDMPRTAEGEWRKRADLEDDSSIELLGPAGNVRAYPTERTEQAPDGSVAQVYEVPSEAADAEDAPL